MRRNQSAPPNIIRADVENKSQLRPNTTPMGLRRNKRAMSVFKEIKLKPACKTIGNMLVLLDDDEKYFKKEWPIRSRTMLNLKQ
jgi:hypothetical protein